MLTIPTSTTCAHTVTSARDLRATALQLSATPVQARGWAVVAPLTASYEGTRLSTVKDRSAVAPLTAQFGINAVAMGDGIGIRSWSPPA
jgi:hypothetical protein